MYIERFYPQITRIIYPQMAQIIRK